MNAKQTSKHTVRASSGTRTGKFVARRCAGCGSKNTVLVVDCDYKGCECKDCGFSTDLTN